MKVCPFAELPDSENPHTSASRSQLTRRIRESREQEMEFSSPQRDVFDRTSAYYTALQRTGCSASADNDSSEILSGNKERLALRRGYPDMPNRCNGQLLYRLSFEGTPYIK